MTKVNVNGFIYAIIDNVANALVGRIWAEKTPAAAIRTYGDLANNKDSIVGAHTADFDLYELGQLNDNYEILPHKELVISGKAWAAAQQPTGPQLVDDLKEAR